MTVDVKICGVKSPEALEAAIGHGARWIGLVFYPRSPRAVDPVTAAALARMIPTGVRAVGLFVDPDNETLERTLAGVPLDMIQLHGRESPDRTLEIRLESGIPVMKALQIGSAEDLMQVGRYADNADWLLFDAKPPDNVTSLPGGNGVPFDWSLLAGRVWPVPWMLSGGLTVDNVAEAVAESGAVAVDVSSGVEDRPGHKDPAKIADFLSRARNAGAPRDLR